MKTGACYVCKRVKEVTDVPDPDSIEPLQFCKECYDVHNLILAAPMLLIAVTNLRAIITDQNKAVQFSSVYPNVLIELKEAFRQLEIAYKRSQGIW